MDDDMTITFARNGAYKGEVDFTHGGVATTKGCTTEAIKSSNICIEVIYDTLVEQRIEDRTLEGDEKTIGPLCRDMLISKGNMDLSNQTKRNVNILGVEVQASVTRKRLEDILRST